MVNDYQHRREEIGVWEEGERLGEEVKEGEGNVLSVYDIVSR